MQCVYQGNHIFRDTHLATVGNISPVTVYTMSKASVAKNFPIIANAVLVVSNSEQKQVFYCIMSIINCVAAKKSIINYVNHKLCLLRN